MDFLEPQVWNEQNRQQIVDSFFREGCALISGVLPSDLVTELRQKSDAYAKDPHLPAKHMSTVYETIVLRRCHELDPLYASMVTFEPILSIVKSVLGEGAQFNALNVIRSEPGTAISRWHVDDVLEFPLPESIVRFDARIRMPVFWMTVQVALSDINSVEHGPTQYVPQSHYSGRHPKPPENPEFEGRGATSVLCKAGDIYLTNHQCWHRGAPNTSDRVRYVMQLQYAQGWADRRFKGIA